MKRRFPKTRGAAAAAVALAAACAAAGEVRFSDGEVLEGRLFFAPGTTLRVHAPGRLAQVDPATVREIRFRPGTERMERAWMFPEPGQTRKVYRGDPYPTRELEAVVRLQSGGELGGHLYTVPLYVEAPGAPPAKVVLWAKQRGAEGETLDALRYPVLVRFDAAAGGGAVRRLVLPPGLAGADAEVAALAQGSLLRLAARAADGPGAWDLDALPGDRLIAGCREGARIVVGWPAAEDPALRSRVEKALADVRDFFDRRELLGTCRDGPGGDIHALMRLSREDPTTLGGARNRPWRVGVWRWVAGEDGERLLLAARGHLFRGIGEQGALPRVERSEALWRAAGREPAASPPAPPDV